MGCLTASLPLLDPIPESARWPELHRRLARGFRNRTHYRLRMILAGGGLTPPILC